MLAPLASLFPIMVLVSAQPMAPCRYQDTLTAYRDHVLKATRRSRTETTQDVVDRLERISAPAQYDSIHLSLVVDAKRWARAEARYYRFIGAEPTTCLSGSNGYGCGDPQRRLSREATTLGFEVRVAREAFVKTWIGLTTRLKMDLHPETATGAA